MRFLRGTYIGSVKLFPMIHQFPSSGTRSLCGGRCKEKPRSQVAVEWTNELKKKELHPMT